LSVCRGEAGLTPDERAVVSAHLGREPRDVAAVAARCPFGWPAVIETRPIFSNGDPNPTLVYLTCPVLAKEVSRKEAAGGVRELRTLFASDEKVRWALLEMTRLYRERRAALGAERILDVGALAQAARGGEAARRDLDMAGIGGPSDPAKASCLHAYAAALLAVMQGWLPPVEGVEAVWAKLGLPTDRPWCDDDRCSELARQSGQAEVT
jgi:uncharacterized protein